MWCVLLILIIILSLFLSSVSCIPLDGPDNGVIDCTGSVYGDTCAFTCDDGYELTGSDTRTCQSDGNWNGTEAECEQGNIINFAVVCIPDNSYYEIYPLSFIVSS